MLSSHRSFTQLSRPGPCAARLQAFAAIALGTILVAAPLAAQGPGTFELFAQRKEASSQPIFGGISFAHYSGPIGLRFSGGLNFRGDDNTAQTGVSADVGGYDCRYTRCDSRRGRGRGGRVQEDFGGFGFMPTLGGWTADADLIVAPVRAVAPLRALLLGFSPYGFVGVGGYSVHPSNAIDTTRATWSLGAGAHHQLLGALGIAAEARYRQPFTSDSGISPDWKQKLEYRASLTISFGGHKRSQPAVVSAPAPVAPCSSVPCGGGPAVASTVDPRLASRVLDVADGLVDTPYRAGGDTPRSGFDAGSFVQYVFGEEGVKLPSSVEDLSHTGTAVSTTIGSLRPGDLLFFSNDGTNADHVAIYAGRERIIHSTASGNGVRYDTLGEGERGHWFADHLIRARRVLTADASNAPAPRDDNNDRGDRAPRPTRSIP
jgi:cell wall-associated NlpC family hydrolase